MKRTLRTACLALVFIGGILLGFTGEGRHLLQLVKDDLRQVAHSLRHQEQAVMMAESPADPLLVGPRNGVQPLRTHTISVIQDGALAAGWQDWSWAKHTLASRIPGNDRTAVAVDFSAWSGLSLHASQPVDAWSGSVSIMLNGGATGGQQVALAVVHTDGGYGARVMLGSLLPRGTIPAEQWVTLTLPLHRLVPQGIPIGGLVLQEASGKGQPTMYIGRIALEVSTLADLPAGDTSLTVQIDAGADRQPISPYIYGLAGDDGDAYMRQVRPTLMRWGGNPSSRFNWQIGHAWNAGHDYYYENGDYGNPTGSVSDEAVAHAKQYGAAEWLTIPTLGWVAKDTTSFSFPGPDGKPTDGQGSSCTNRTVTADPTRASIQVSPAFMQDWVRHLQANHLPVQFYSMDNEPDLWGATHYDVHPTCTGYDEIYKEFTTYADAIKAVAPTSLVTGPASCCWKYYWNSMQGDADRAAHGNEDFLPWFLASVHAHDQIAHRRTLDVLDVHYYPDGFYNDNTDALTAAWRLQETRSLWDPSYSDHSWIGEVIQLLPRLQRVVAQQYPGTKLGIGEWSFGAGTSMNGALAIADVLGIFGREGLYMAAYWRNPPAYSPGAMAFQMYRNYDGHGAAFGETSVRATSSNRDRVSVYASLRRSDGHLVIILINKMPTTRAMTKLDLRGIVPKHIDVFRFDGTHPQGILEQGNISPGPQVNVPLPPYSLTLLDVAGEGAH